MALLLIREAGQRDRRFQIRGKECIIGRDTSSDLILPHTTVSRQHSKISRLSKTQAFIKNLSQKNSLLVNGEKIDKSPIKTKDTFQVGKYTLVYFGDSLTPMDQFFEGTSLDEFPIYARTANETKDDTTFSLSAIEAQRLLKNGNLTRNARIFSEDRKQYWVPEKKGLNFGKSQAIPISGWFTGGIAATVSWTGATHALERKSSLAKILINGQKLSKLQDLNEGDQIQIGKSIFIYDVVK